MRESLIQLLTLMATLGQEYCLIRDNVQSKQGEAVSPLPPHIQATIDEIHVNDAETEGETTSKDDEVAMLLLERLEAAHVLLYATMAAPQVDQRASASPAEKNCSVPRSPRSSTRRSRSKPSSKASVAPDCGRRHRRHSRLGRSEISEIVALADECGEHIWPKLSDLLAVDIPGRASSMGESVVRLSASGVTRAVIEGSARLIGLLLRSGRLGVGPAETAILAPHTAATFWRVAMAPQRALAMRLYSRLVDISPIYYGGVGVPLLKLWARATMDPAAGGISAGMNRARASNQRSAAKRHPVLFAAFHGSPSSKDATGQSPSRSSVARDGSPRSYTKPRRRAVSPLAIIIRHVAVQPRCSRSRAGIRAWRSRADHPLAAPTSSRTRSCFPRRRRVYTPRS